MTYYDGAEQPETQPERMAVDRVRAQVSSEPPNLFALVQRINELSVKLDKMTEACEERLGCAVDACESADKADNARPSLNAMARDAERRLRGVTISMERILGEVQ